MNKKIVILGSTGSIGVNTLNIVSSLPGRFEVVGLVAGTSASKVAEQANTFGVKRLAMADPAAASELRDLVDSSTRVLAGEGGIEELVAESGADIVVCAMVGMSALRPVLAAINAGMDVALATKEVLVAAGELVCALARQKRVNLLPIDSEHSAIFQSLNDVGRTPACARSRALQSVPLAASEQIIDKLWLTASGGPFFFHPEIDFDKVTLQQALNHPRWKMGPKVTIDSATMMNKGLEILEARWLFDIPATRIGVLVHPQSIVHSLVEFTDGAQIAQLGYPDMRLPIQYALTWPERVANATLPRLDLAKAAELHFCEPDEKRFPCLSLAREASANGGVCTCAMNAAGEVAVQAFLKERIRFSAIPEIIAQVVRSTPPHDATPTLDDLFAADRWAREQATAMVDSGTYAQMG